jgi:hypothetical protein
MKEYSLDVERWCAEGLVDATMLSPFPHSPEDVRHYPEYHVAVAHAHGVACYGGIGSYNLIKNGNEAGVWENTGFYHPKPVYRLALRQHDAGVDAMTLYQSDSLIHMSYLDELFRVAADPAALRARTAELPDPDLPENYLIGTDWHSRIPERVKPGR